MTRDVALYVLGMNRSASIGQCRPCVSFFEQVPMLSVRDACTVSSNESLSMGSKTRSSALYRLETTIPAALGRSSQPYFEKDALVRSEGHVVQCLTGAGRRPCTLSVGGSHVRAPTGRAPRARPPARFSSLPPSLAPRAKRGTPARGGWGGRPPPLAALPPRKPPTRRWAVEDLARDTHTH